MGEEKNIMKEFEQAIDFLNKDNNLVLFEEKVNSYITSNSNLNIAKYTDFQLELNFIVDQHIGILFNYLKGGIDIAYEGRHREIYRRITKLRKLSQIHFILMENALSNPITLKGIMISHSVDYPKETLLTLTKNNNEYFQTLLDFNNMLNLTNALLDNMVQRFNAGNNNINLELYNNQFRNRVDTFMTMMDHFVNEENEKK